MVRRCKELDILLVYDNAYSELAYDGYVPPSIFEIEGAREVAIEFHSMSKTYNMTGWRCGWACGRPEIVGALAKVKSFIDTGTFMAIQAAAATALDECADWIPQNVAAFKERRDAAVECVLRRPGFPCVKPKATMYLWLPLPKNIPSAVFGERLLQDEGVIVLPGLAVRPRRRRILSRLVHRVVGSPARGGDARRASAQAADRAGRRWNARRAARPTSEPAVARA